MTPKSQNLSNPHRIAYLDGLRGIAILMVVLFHAYARWPDLYSYGDAFTTSLFLNTGVTGVKLFFMISGFVILMTLENCSGFKSFLWRRWKRLFPALLIACLLIYATAPLFPERPSGAVHLVAMVTDISLLGADIVHPVSLAFGLPVYKNLEGAFWTLIAEIRFYVIFGLAYFAMGRRGAIASLFFIWGISYLAFLPHYDYLIDHVSFLYKNFNSQRSVIFESIKTVSGFFLGEYYGCFITGAALYIHKNARTTLGAATGIALWAIASFLSVASANEYQYQSAFVACLFLLATLSPLAQRVIANRIFLFLGFISYPLYLVHENMMVALIVKIGHFVPELPAFLIPLLPICIVVFLGWVIAKYAEPALKRSLFRSATPSR